MAIGVREAAGLFGAAEVIAAADEMPDPLRRRLNLLGVLIDRTDRAAALARIRDFLESGSAHQVVTVNLDFLSQAERNEEFRTTINEADLAVADGMPIVWISHLLGTPLAERVTGVDLVNDCCQLAAATGTRVFLLGAAPGVAETAARRAQEQHPGLEVATYAPPLGPISPEEDARIVEAIAQVRPGFLFVALGAPRQDLWIRAHRDILDVPVSMGVGCVLDLLAGTVRRAPTWMRSTGFEWSFRLMQEPGRLWRRYLLDDLPLFGRLSLMALDAQLVPRRSAGGRASGGLS